MNKSSLNINFAEVTLSSTYSAKECAKYKGVENMNWIFKMIKAEIGKENLCS